MGHDLLEKLTNSLIEGEPELTVDLTRQALEAGLEPMMIIDQGSDPRNGRGRPEVRQLANIFYPT